MELQFEKFDLKNLVYDADGNFLNPRIAIIAKSGSGKSWVIREILYYLYKTRIPCGTVIAPTDKMNKLRLEVHESEKNLIVLNNNIKDLQTEKIDYDKTFNENTELNGLIDMNIDEFTCDW
jgi:hypothetical protein